MSKSRIIPSFSKESLDPNIPPDVTFSKVTHRCFRNRQDGRRSFYKTGKPEDIDPGHELDPCWTDLVSLPDVEDGGDFAHITLTNDSRVGNYEGKWMIWPTHTQVSALWQQIVERVREGQLLHAKVNITIRPKTLTTHLIAIYTADCLDIPSVLAAARALSNLPFELGKRLTYMTNEETHTRINLGLSAKALLRYENDSAMLELMDGFSNLGLDEQEHILAQLKLLSCQEFKNAKGRHCFKLAVD